MPPQRSANNLSIHQLGGCRGVCATYDFLLVVFMRHARRSPSVNDLLEEEPSLRKNASLSAVPWLFVADLSMAVDSNKLD